MKWILMNLKVKQKMKKKFNNYEFIMHLFIKLYKFFYIIKINNTKK